MAPTTKKATRAAAKNKTKGKSSDNDARSIVADPSEHVRKGGIDVEIAGLSAVRLVGDLADLIDPRSGHSLTWEGQILTDAERRELLVSIRADFKAKDNADDGDYSPMDDLEDDLLDEEGLGEDLEEEEDDLD